MAKSTPDRIIDTPETATAGRASQYSSGATSSATIVADHTHNGTANSGGSTLTAVTTNWLFLLDGATATLQAALDRLDTYGMMAKRSIDSGDTLTIPTNHSMVVVGPYSIDGTLDLAGILEII